MNSDGARGVLLGLAWGDALGRPVEFMSADAITAEHGRLDEMVGNGTWNQQAGTITDDTEQAVCIARSVVEKRGFDPVDIATRFVAWYDSDPFDIGRMTMQSLSRLKHGDEWNEAGKQVWEASSASALNCYLYRRRAPLDSIQNFSEVIHAPNQTVCRRSVCR